MKIEREDLAKSLTLQALDINHETGDIAALGYGMVLISYVMHDTGEYLDCYTFYTRALMLAYNAHMMRIVVFSIYSAGRLAVTLGRFTEATAALQGALAQSKDRTEKWVPELESRLRLFAKGQPYRESPKRVFMQKPAEKVAPGA